MARTNKGAAGRRLDCLIDLVIDQQDEILAALARIERILAHMSPELQSLADQVAADATVEASAVTLITGLAKKVDDLAAALTASQGDSTKLDNIQADAAALAAQMKASSDALAAAVAANTPSAPAASPAPAPSPTPDPTPSPTNDAPAATAPTT